MKLKIGDNLLETNNYYRILKTRNWNGIVFDYGLKFYVDKNNSDRTDNIWFDNEEERNNIFNKIADKLGYESLDDIISLPNNEFDEEYE